MTAFFPTLTALAAVLATFAVGAAGAALIRDMAAQEAKRRTAALRAIRVRAGSNGANRYVRKGQAE